MEPAPFLSTPPGGTAPDSCWRLNAADGVGLRAALWEAPDAKAHAIFLTGRSEFIEKAAVPAAQLMARGYSVVSLDWRGQGLSDRLIEPRSKGHVADFAQYQRDLDTLLADDTVAALPGPRVLFAHSMGGNIGVAALARPEIASTLKAAVLSAPMLDFAMSGITRALGRVAILLARLFGRLDCWPPVGNASETYVLTDVDPAENVLTHDLALWEWMISVARAHPEVTLAMPTLGWLDAANREIARIRTLPPPTVPSMTILGSDEDVVSPDEIRSWAARTGSELLDIQGGRHELLIEAEPMRARAWAGIDRFLSEQGLPHGPLPGG